jgi:D-inositol-3-phosphate glycosyltransferase
VIPYGIDPARFHPIPGARKRLGIPEDKLFLLYVGRFSPEKGLLDLIDALAYIRPLLDPARVEVALVGRGPQGDELRQQIVAADLDQIVHIRDWVAQEELSTWYSAADALVLPSHSEGFSRTIPEAMSCGTPIIGSRITGTEDHVQDFVNGFLFPAQDSKALSRILQELITHPDEVRGMRMRVNQYVQVHLSWSFVLRRILNEAYMPILQQYKF